MIESNEETKIYVRNSNKTQINTANQQEQLILDFFSEFDASTIKARFDRLVEVVGYPPQNAIDFMLLSGAIYVTDKTVLRRSSSDRWTRKLNITSPVGNKDLWSEASSDLINAISFLTGDQWQFGWVNEVNQLWHADKVGAEKFDAVCLFSGGLDSLIGAINLLEDRKNKRILLIGHYDSNLTPKTQQILFEKLKEYYGPDRVKLIQVLLRPSENLPNQQYPLPTKKERTTRSRSLVFISLGLAAASACGTKIPLFVPENGFIALNVPLTPARLGSCSTRTTHPYFFNCLNKFLKEIGLINPILNPYQYQTKGQMMQTCLNMQLLEELARSSVSCSRPEAGRFKGGKYGNCGYCFPCLIRRASMHTVNLDIGSDYFVDVCTDESFLQDHRVASPSRDAKAIFKALYTSSRQRDPNFFTRSSIISGPIENLDNLNKHSQVYQQGLTELRNLFLDKATAEVKKLASIE